MTLTGNRQAAPRSRPRETAPRMASHIAPGQQSSNSCPNTSPTQLLLSLEFYRESVLRRVVDDRGRVTLAIVDIAK
jgi:hypothetical protein